MKTLEPRIGSGLYTVKEAALFARVPARRLNRWLFGESDKKAVLTPQFGRGEKLVSFLDLVQALAIREIQLQHHVDLKRFRQAVDWARKSLRIDYPFARRHFTYLYGKELVIEFRKGQYVEVSGKHVGQGLLKEIVQSYLLDLSFDSTGLAREFTIYTSRDQVPVVMDPERNFGAPLLPSGYSALAIAEAVVAEGGIPQAAAAYGILREEADAAYKFMDYLGATVA